MTRRRRLPLASRVCIGVFLLLFSNVAANTIKGPPTILEKAHPAGSDATKFQKNGTLPGVASASNRTHDIAPLPEDGESTDLSDRSSIEGLAELDDPAKDAKAESNKEKVPTSAERDSVVQGIRSRDGVNGSSASDSTNGSSRYEEIVYGTSGKSSSTKAVPEGSDRLPGTNGLATGTTRPSFEEASSKNDEKHENREAVDETVEVTTEKFPREASKSRDDEGSVSKTELRRVLSRLGARDKSNVSKLRNEGPVDAEDARESTTPRGFVEEARGRKKTAEKESKNTEVTDLERADEKGENGGAISLINDTYVNYSHYYKTTAGKRPEAGGGRQPGVPENGTNFISKDGAVSHEWQDPKEEVEVVGNVTHTPNQRIVLDEQIAGNRSSLAGRNASRHENELEGAKGTRERDEENGETAGSVDTAKTNGYLNGNGKQKRVNGKDEPSRSTETGSIRGNERNEEESTTRSNGPVPRGRTIEFSGVNEFSSLETKTTVSASKEIDVPVSKKNVSLDKFNEQKPYPYVRSGKESSDDSNSSRSNEQRQEETTEESSAFENTIGRGQSGKKFIVTEPSVVIENSIQQYKPSYREKSTNGSINSTSGSQSTASMTTKSMDEVRPTNQTLRGDSFGDLGTINDKSTAESTSSGGNDVPRGNEGSKVITGKDENFDVTGNGITEVNSKAESSEEANKRASYEPPFRGEERTANGTTEFSLIMDPTAKPQTEGKVLSSMDVQTDAEESLLIRSTLNVTELSTEYPLTRENTSEKIKSKSSTASLQTSTYQPAENTSVFQERTGSENSADNATLESSGATETNGTNVTPSLTVVTLNPDESSIPTTTGVEYEFVGLSESTVLPSQMVTEKTVDGEATEGRTETNVSAFTVPAVQDLSGNNTTVEEVVTTASRETIENTTTSIETETTILDDRSSSVPATDQTLIPTTMQTTMGVEEISTGSTIVEEQTEQTITKTDDNEGTTVTNDSWSTTEESIVTAGDTEGPSTGKEHQTISNDTEASTGTTDAAISNVTSATGSTIPFAPSSSRPRIAESSTVSTSSTSGSGSTTERTTEATQTLSPDEITSLVRIVMKGTWHEVCPHLDTLRFTLAEILRSGMNKSVYAKQIMFHQNPCLEPPSPSPTPTDDPLTSILVYVVDEDGKFDSEMTNILPRLYTNSSVNFPVTIHSFLLVQETDSGNAIAVVVVSSVAFICLVLLAGLLFIMRKRQTRFNYGERCRPVSLDAYSLDSVSAYNSVRRKGAARSSKRSYGNPTFEDSSAIPSHPLNFAGLSSFCNDVNAINEEFSGIPQVSAKIDELPAGAELKNRYANVIPLPETRVPLQKMNNDPLTEYINASYVRGPKNATRYYIACQGPMESTVTDFWRMIWEQQCKVIIMLTDLVENGVEKCTEYIPPSEVTDCHRLYGDYQVTLKKRETKEKYAISTLHLKNLENNTYREVYHIWYLWPVNGVQSDGAGLIAVLLEARALQRGGPAPIVVHCSPGTGRTGTLIALDLGIRQYEITRTVDVPRVVYIIRRDRAGAVQTKEQYAFIYKALNLYATKLAGGVLEST